MPCPLVVTGDTEVTKTDVGSCHPVGEVGVSWDWRERLEF